MLGDSWRCLALRFLGVTMPAGQSAILSVDRRLGETWVVAARWSKSFRRLTSDYRELYSAGLIRLQPFEMDGDSLGFGVFLGRPSDGQRGNEYGAEVFCKLRLTQDTSVMPDIQILAPRRSAGRFRAHPRLRPARKFFVLRPVPGRRAILVWR